MIRLSLLETFNNPTFQLQGTLNRATGHSNSLSIGNLVLIKVCIGQSNPLQICFQEDTG